ncbi:DUF1127 domain-containing protein [Inquilinus sp. CA228]|uniref:DUF1127 domain-containing protein n=1 Tax=Inquilinus sp. CA228 TaxID=3455609 RepID=UPI003F8D5EA8
MHKRQIFTVLSPAQLEASALWGPAAVTEVQPGRAVGGDCRLRQTVDLWLRRARTRRRLGELSDRDLRDVGLDRSAAIREANKPFWMG